MNKEKGDDIKNLISNNQLIILSLSENNIY